MTTVYDIDRRDLAQAEATFDRELALTVRRRLRSDVCAPSALIFEANRILGLCVPGAGA